ncbi:ABC transporter ATP-binding protein [bacterium]|nr:MAG: ABC transporter ATP-binding protein [bacterium]RIK65590.1 MAG: multidrug ABC transporter ATP-binding protein [Planctomycetota bacterium]
MAAVVLDNLTKTFRDFLGRRRVRALDGLCLSVHKGEVFGLLGPNGSGKSTAFKICVGLLRPDAGQARILDHAPGSLAARMATGYLPEESTLLPHLTARETLRLLGALSGLTRQECARRADALLERLGLKEAGARRVKGFSKGMQRRLGVAGVLMADPQVFILDEPTSGLDPLGARDMKQLILELAGKGKTIIISSHLLGEIENVCHRVAFLNQGRLLRQGTLDELLREQGVHELRVSPADPGAVAALENLARERGLRIEKSGVPLKTLESFYVDVLGKRAGEP